MNNIPQEISTAVVFMLKPYVPGFTQDKLEKIIQGETNQIRPLLKISEASEILNLSEITIRRMVGDGRLASVKVGGTSRRILRRSIENLLEEKHG